MQGLILAAGMGSRLRHLTKNNTKGMVEVNGISLMERMLKQLEKLNLSKIIIVTGYEGEKLKNYISTLSLKTPLQYIHNPIYDSTNNIYSLSLASEVMSEDDTILLESDLIFEDELLQQLIQDNRKNLALVAKYESWMDGTCVCIENNQISQFVLGKDFDYQCANEYYKTINIYKFSKDFSKNCYFPFLKAYMSTLGVNEYYEAVLKMIVDMKTNLLEPKIVEDINWYEIDDEQDLDIASSIFETKEKKLELFQKRYGGYWRYPKLLDFCYLVNPYFPPQKMVDEIQYNFKHLMQDYPSGLGVNRLLASKNFNVKYDYITIGNGASELIKSVMESIKGNVGFIRPTFEEYPNRYPNQNHIVFVPETNDFSYTTKDIIQYFEKQNLSALVCINPDNPSGNYLPKSNVLELMKWTNEKNITLIFDESFIDFTTELDTTFLDNDILESYPNVIVVKSISKSYGVPGFRLGVCACSDLKVINKICKDVAIWNINSFGEYYMQIYGKYHKFYKQGILRFIEERKRFVERLKKIPQIDVFPSQANYLMIELLEGNSLQLTTILLEKYNIFIKDLTPKIKKDNRQYIRVAVRNTKDNDALIDALQQFYSIK